MAASLPPPLTPNACLIGILLVVRSSSGPALVFHYPPRPKLDISTSPSHAACPEYNTSTSSSESGSSSDEDDERQSHTNTIADVGRAVTEASDTESRSRGYLSRRGKRRDRESSVDRAKGRGDGIMPWEKVLGFRTHALAGLLAPKASTGKGKFEMSIDDMVFMGQPVHIRPDGLWRKKKKRRRSNREDIDEEDEDVVMEATGDDEDGDVKEDEEVERNGDRAIEFTDPLGHHDADDEGEDADSARRRKEEEAMSMFHIVMVLNPPELEYHFRTQEIYNYVAKGFSRALKYEQAKDGYVWREAEKISRLKEQVSQKEVKFSDLWKQIMDQSSLAYAISRIFTDISQSKIAHVLLNNSFGLSLQIPVVSEISVLPSITEPQVPGLPLTTANSFGDDENKGDSLLAKHFTLLYLDDVDSILKDLAAEPTAFSSSLAHFVKACKPTASFLTISNQCGIPLHEIQVLARHLVQWRKARAIPPIHQRDMYIVSPNADMKRLPQLIEMYRCQFPSLPALPKILSLLSSKPKPYATFIPSKDHRGAYLEILTWLVRHGLVTQLRNFAWIKVPSSIKIAVHRERIVKRAAAAAVEGAASPPASPPVLPDHMINSTSSLLSNSLASLTEDEDGDEGSGNFDDSFILEPDRASGIESAWLEMMTRSQPPDVKALFERFLKYLNGRHALEKISVREGISRKEVRRVLRALQVYVIYARHW